jgi:hypothetical protein
MKSHLLNPTVGLIFTLKIFFKHTSRSGLRRAGGWTVVVVLVCWVCCVVTMMTVFFRTTATGIQCLFM